MKLKLRRAVESDAQKIIEARTKSFYADYVKFGECPGYQRSVEQMKTILQKADVYVLELESLIIGDISLHQLDSERCRWIGCVEIIPEFQNKGIGSVALKQIFKLYPEVKKWQLETPVQRERNCHFYEKLGFRGIEDKVHSSQLTLRVYEKVQPHIS